MMVDMRNTNAVGIVVGELEEDRENWMIWRGLRINVRV